MTKGRILCLTSNFPRWEGDSTTPFVLSLCQDLRALGWQVDVLAPHAPDAEVREVLGGISVERFRYAFPESAETVCYQGGALVNLRKRPLEKLKLPLLVGAEWIATQARLFERDYDVVHAHWILPQGFVGAVASALSGVPLVVTVHGGDLFALRAPVYRAAKRIALRAAASVTVNSSFTERGVRELVPESVPERIPMGVETRELTARERELAAELRRKHRAGDGPLLVFVGRLVEEKGCGDAIRALRLVLSERPTAKLLVAGAGPEEESLRRLAEDCGGRERVVFLGWVAPDDVRAHLAAADIFVGPSRTAPDGWVEAQGLTFLEAMTVGTPVVASRLGGIVDAVVHEHTGLLVPERSPDELARAILRLADDAELGARLARAAQKLVEATFSRAASASAFDRVLVDARDAKRRGTTGERRT